MGGHGVVRYYRITDDALYERTRLALDAAWGHRPPVTCVEPAATAPRDASGAIVLSVRAQFLTFPAAAAALPGLLASGKVVEITRDQYLDALPRGKP